MTLGNNDSDVLAEAHDLIVALQEEQVTEAQARRLETLVCQNTAVRRLYVIYLHQRCVIAAMAHPASENSVNEKHAAAGLSMDDTMVVGAINTNEPFEAEEV